MATISELKKALINADKAGDTEAARKLAAIIQRNQNQPTNYDVDSSGNVIETQIPETIQKKIEPSIMEKIKGSGEAALAATLGGAAGAAGTIVGTGKGLLKNIQEGTYGTRKGGEQMEEAQTKTAQQFAEPFMPSSEVGQKYLQNVTEAIAPLQAFPMLSEWDQIATLAKASKPILATKATEQLNKIITAPEKISTAIPKAEVLPKSTTSFNIGEIAQKAASGNKKAKAQLVEESKINPEALKSAERLDIDLPIDVYSDSELLKQTAGLTRSQIGPESAAWKDAVQNAANKADEAMAKLGGAESKAEVSGKVQDLLNTSRNDIKQQASTLYNKVDSIIPKGTKIQPNNIMTTLNEISNEVGGLDMLSPIEKNLYKNITDGSTTYGGLLRLKSQIGDALGGKQAQNPFGSIDTASLKRLYGAIKNDQLDAVGSVGGIEAREKLHFANRLTIKQKALEDRMVKAFGKEGEGSISSLMNRAISQGAKGDTTALNKLLKAVPPEMHKEVLATALADLTTSQRAGEAGMFDFARFAKTYQGLRKNAPVYNTIIKSLGKDKDMLLSDLYSISKRVTEARANVLTTGKANQEILKGMQSENFIKKIISKTLSDVVSKTSAGTISIDSLLKSPSDKIKQIGEMFRSKEFKDLVTEASVKKPSEAKIKKFINSRSFKEWAKAVDRNNKIGRGAEIITNPTLWVLNSMSQEKSKDQNKSKF